VLKEQSEQWDISEKRHLIEISSGISREDTTNDSGMSVHDEQFGFRFSFEDGGVASCGRLGEVGLISVDFDAHGHASIGGNVGANEQLEFGFSEAGLDTHGADLGEGDHGALADGGFMVIQSQDAWAGDDADHTARFRGRETKGEIDGVVDMTEGQTDGATGAGAHGSGQVDGKIGVLHAAIEG